MKKLLIILFFVLVLAFGVVGYMQPDDPNQVVDQNDHSVLRPS